MHAGPRDGRGGIDYDITTYSNTYNGEQDQERNTYGQTTNHRPTAKIEAPAGQPYGRHYRQSRRRRRLQYRPAASRIGWKQTLDGWILGKYLGRVKVLGRTLIPLLRMTMMAASELGLAGSKCACA